MHSGRSSVASVSKSVEKLMGAFQLSVSLDASDDSAYLKSQSIENIESETDELFDDLQLFDATASRRMTLGSAGQRQQQHRNQRQLAAATYTAMSPSKVTIPADGAQFRARVLSFGSPTRGPTDDNGVTDIW